MRLSIFIVVLIFLSTATIFAQPDTLWTKTFSLNADDYGRHLELTTDGGYIIVGYTGSYSVYDVYLIKTDAYGNELWYSTFGGSESDEGHAVKQTADGGYIIVGTTKSYSVGWSDIYLVKTDSLGNEIWYQTFGGTLSEVCHSVQLTTDGGYIITGGTGSFGFLWHNVYLIKTDSEGNELWHNTFGGSLIDEGCDVQLTTDGGYIIVGSTESFGADIVDIYLIKTDSLGNEQWSQTYGGFYEDFGYSVQQSGDGGYVIAGLKSSSYLIETQDLYLIKTDAEGNELWSQTLGGDYSDGALCIQITEDDGYIIAGWYGYEEYCDVYIVKTDVHGNYMWHKIIGSNLNDYGSCVRQTSDSGYIIVGTSGDYFSGFHDVYLIRLDSEGTHVKELNQTDNPSSFILHPNYPNPFNQSTVISYKLQAASYMELKVYDVTSREVAKLVDSYQSAGTHEVIFDASGLSSGIYLVQLTSNGKIQTQKLVLMK